MSDRPTRWLEVEFHNPRPPMTILQRFWHALEADHYKAAFALGMVVAALESNPPNVGMAMQYAREAQQRLERSDMI